MISHGPLNESPAILSADLSLGPPHLAYRLYCAVSTVEKIGVGIATSLPGICQSYRIKSSGNLRFYEPGISVSHMAETPQ